MSASPIEFSGPGRASWEHKAGDQYVITGVGPDGRRLPTLTYSNWTHAAMTNLYRGTKWLLRDGKRYKISEHYN